MGFTTKPIRIPDVGGAATKGRRVGADENVRV
jgi:hypothetical protein